MHCRGMFLPGVRVGGAALTDEHFSIINLQINLLLLKRHQTKGPLRWSRRRIELLARTC